VKAFDDHFAAVAAAYARFRPQYPPELLDALATHCARRDLAWDCACGSGQATLALAERFDAVIASDASADQVAAAPPHPRITYRVAPAEASGLDAATVDLITVAQSLHWFDVERFYAEVRRVARRPCLLAVWTYATLHVEDPRVDACVQEVYSELLGPYWPPERRHVEAGYRTLPFPFAELELPPFAMRARWVLGQLIGMIASWSAVAGFRKARGADPLPGIARSLEAVWGDASRELEITWPLTVRAGRVPPG
jgi:SAM-dependent methyltransferase